MGSAAASAALSASSLRKREFLGLKLCKRCGGRRRLRYCRQPAPRPACEHARARRRARARARPGSSGRERPAAAQAPPAAAAASLRRHTPACTASSPGSRACGRGRTAVRPRRRPRRADRWRRRSGAAGPPGRRREAPCVAAPARHTAQPGRRAPQRARLRARSRVMGRGVSALCPKPAPPSPRRALARRAGRSAAARGARGRSTGRASRTAPP